jgi:hypothetical protein
VFDFDIKTKSVNILELDSTSSVDMPFNINYDVVDYLRGWCIELLERYILLDDNMRDIRTLSVARTMDERVTIEFQSEEAAHIENFDLITMSTVSSVIGVLSDIYH